MLGKSMQIGVHRVCVRVRARAHACVCVCVKVRGSYFSLNAMGSYWMTFSRIQRF